jgi:hypothetical protein
VRLSPLRFLVSLILSLASLLISGCTTAGSASVTASPSPGRSPAQPLPTLADGDEKLLWQLPDTGL